MVKRCLLFIACLCALVSADEAELTRQANQVYPRVELHLHFEGTMRRETAYDLLKKKNLPVLGDGTLPSFLDRLDALHYLEVYDIFLTAMKGDLEAIERNAYELCETQAKEGVIYSEVHYPPHFLLPENFHKKSTTGAAVFANPWQRVQVVTTRDVVAAVNRGMERGRMDFGVTIRSVLACIRTKPEWSQEVLNLAIEFRNSGVVGLDIMGDIFGITDVDQKSADFKDERLFFQKEHIAAFQMADRLGIKTTAHVGVFGPPNMVIKALDELKVDRIGHGYRLLEDEALYEKITKSGVHFEVSPSTGILFYSEENNPTVRYNKDSVSYSISSDIPTATKSSLDKEYKIMLEKGVTVKQLQQSNIEAMKHSFAEPALKNAVLDLLYRTYGIIKPAPATIIQRLVYL